HAVLRPQPEIPVMALEDRVNGGLQHALFLVPDTMRILGKGFGGIETIAQRSARKQACKRSGYYSFRQKKPYLTNLPRLRGVARRPVPYTLRFYAQRNRSRYIVKLCRPPAYSQNRAFS